MSQGFLSKYFCRCLKHIELKKWVCMLGHCRTEKIQNYCLLCVTVDVYLVLGFLDLTDGKQFLLISLYLYRSHGNISHPVSCDEFFPHHYWHQKCLCFPGSFVLIIDNASYLSLDKRAQGWWWPAVGLCCIILDLMLLCCECLLNAMIPRKLHVKLLSERSWSCQTLHF